MRMTMASYPFCYGICPIDGCVRLGQSSDRGLAMPFVKERLPLSCVLRDSLQHGRYSRLLSGSMAGAGQGAPIFAAAG